jgi:hypothetical protein
MNKIKPVAYMTKRGAVYAGASRGDGNVMLVPESALEALQSENAELERQAEQWKCNSRENKLIAEDLNRQLEESRNGKKHVCAWTPMDREEMPGTYEGDCGVAWSFIDGGIQDNDLKYCPRCGGEVIDIDAAIKAQGGE